MTTRRRLLKWGLATGVLGLAGGLTYRAVWGRGTVATGLKVLTADERDLIAALAAVYFPGGDGLPASSDVDVVGHVDHYVAQLPGNLGKLFQLLIRTVDWSGISEGGRFSRLSLEARTRLVDAWEQSTLDERRSAFLALKLVVGSGYYDDPRVRTAIGVVSPCGPSQVEEWL